jgi:hypothetical protein
MCQSCFSACLYPQTAKHRIKRKPAFACSGLFSCSEKLLHVSFIRFGQEIFYVKVSILKLAFTMGAVFVSYCFNVQLVSQVPGFCSVNKCFYMKGGLDERWLGCDQHATDSCLHAYIHTYMHRYIHAYKCTYTHSHHELHANTHTHMKQMHIHTYKIHTNTHTYTHMHSSVEGRTNGRSRAMQPLRRITPQSKFPKWSVAWPCRMEDCFTVIFRGFPWWRAQGG